MINPIIHLLDGGGIKSRSLSDYSSWDTNQWNEYESGSRSDGSITISDAYRNVGWFKRCVDIRSRAVATLPFTVYRGDKPVWSETTTRPDELRWLQLGPLTYRATQSLILEGAAYAYVERVGRLITRLVPFAASTISVVHDASGNVAGFQRTINNGKPIPVDVDDMWYAFACDTLTEVGPGSPDAHSALPHAQVLYELAAFTAGQLAEGLVKKTVFTSAGPRPPEDARREAENFLTRLLYGRSNTMKARVIGGDLKAQIVGSDLTDLAANAISEEHQSAIATALGIPHSLVASNAANFATAQQDAVNFITGVVSSDADLLAESINLLLLSRYDLELRFEPERVEALQFSEQQKATGMVALVGAGILTIDEARADLGRKPLDDIQAITPKPTPEAVPEAEVEDDADMVPQAGKALDIATWKRKIERRGDREVKFSPDHLSHEEALTIKGRLALGYPIDEVFLAPFFDF
jgi:HK97 family phage portal protein